MPQPGEFNDVVVEVSLPCSGGLAWDSHLGTHEGCDGTCHLLCKSSSQCCFSASPWGKGRQLTWESPFFLCLSLTFIFLVLSINQILLHESLCWSLCMMAIIWEPAASHGDIQQVMVPLSRVCGQFLFWILLSLAKWNGRVLNMHYHAGGVEVMHSCILGNTWTGTIVES